MRVWIKHVPGLRHLRDTVEKLFTEKHAKCRLVPDRTKFHTMCTSSIDESTVGGVKDVLLNLIMQLGALKAWVAQWIIFVAGDQLSVDRLRKLKRYLKKSDSVFDKFQWALPIIQLWHLKWNWQKAIFRMHWWPETGRNIFGLHADARVLGREKFNPDRGDFYPSHDLLEDQFETMVLDILRYVFALLKATPADH